eukprot:scaffold3437_cov31-Tisochrysis_lutea.AAC.4
MTRDSSSGDAPWKPSAADDAEDSTGATLWHRAMASTASYTALAKADSDCGVALPTARAGGAGAAA